jgi:hypothetical protein
MLNILFEPKDIIELRCLHKDQVRKPDGSYEPPPHIFFGTYEEHRKRASELQRLNSMGYNVYFGANPRIGKSKNAVACCRSLFVDLDGGGHSIDQAEANSWLEVLMCEWSVPYPTVILSSGNGIHYYWKLDKEISAAEFNRYQKALIATFNITSKIADPAIHDAPRIMRLPGFVNQRGGSLAAVLEMTDYRHRLLDFVNCLENLPAPLPAPRPLEGYTGDNVGALDRALKYHEKREGCGEGGRNGECYKIAACCQNDFALSEEDCYHVVATWNLKNRPPLPESEIREVIAKAKKHSAANPSFSKDRPVEPKPQRREPEEHKDMGYTDDNDQTTGDNDSYSPTPARSMQGVDLTTVAYMLENYVLIAGTTDIWDLEHGIMMPAAALSLLYPNEIKYWKTDPDRKVILAENLVFEPSGVIKPGQINTFQGFDFPEDTRYMPLLAAHLEFLCNDDPVVLNWVMSWCALQAQQPGTKIASSIIMHGKQGTGKSMFWECFGKIFDPYFGVIDQTILESDFNSWASRRMFVLAEEVLANQSKSKLKNVVKQMVTGGRIQINEKNVKAWWEKCYMNLVFLSNNRLPMLLDEDDRRFMVIRCDRKHDEAYYNALAAEIADNGPARLYHMLKAWDLKGFNAHTKPLDTLAKEDLILFVRDSSKVFLDEWLMGDIDGLPCSAAKKQDLYDGYVAYCRATGLRSNSRKHFYGVITEEYPQLSDRKMAYYRYFAIAESCDVTLFSDSVAKYLLRVQDRRV